MDGVALLKDWPTFDRANAETIFASPAWRLETDYGETPAALAKAREPIQDLLWVSVTLDDEAHVLGIGDFEAFHDLHLLWAKREALPEEMRLALIERECGDLFRVLEKVFRRQLTIKGMAESGAVAVSRRTDFQLTVGESVLGFALDLSPLLVTEVGKLRHLDPGHEAIRTLRRPAWVEYVAIDLLEPEFASLAVGDCIVIPEGVEPAWRMTMPEDDLVHVRSETAGEVTFAQMADDEWPEFPEPGRIVLIKGGRSVARGSLETLGLQRVFKVEEVFVHV